MIGKIEKLEGVGETSTHIAPIRSPSIRSFSGASPHTELVRHVPREASMKRGSGEASPWGKKKVSGARYSATAFLGWAAYDSYHQVLRTV